MYCPFFPPQYSGAAKQALSLAERLRGMNHTIEFLTIRDEGLPDFEVHRGFPVHRLEVNNRRNKEMPLWWNFFRFAFRNRHRFDVLHSHGAHYMNSITGPVAKIMGWKSLVKATMSNDDLFGLKKSASGTLHYLFLKPIRAYIAISRDLVKEFERTGFDRNRIHYIPNGVDTDRFHPADKAEKIRIRKQLDLPQQKRILLSVGVFDHRKNIGWFINEWDRENGYDGDSYLLAIGPQSRDDMDGSFLRSLKDIASRRGRDMLILDHVDNIEQYYRAADVFVLSSTNEGLPNVVLEAMASGLPCLATRSFGTKDLVLEGETGFLYSPNDGAEFAEKLIRFTPDALDRMGRNGRMEIQNKYSLNTIAKSYSDLYENI